MCNKVLVVTMVDTENSNGAIAAVVRVGDRVTAGITAILMQLDLSENLCIGKPRK